VRPPCGRRIGVWEPHDGLGEWRACGSKHRGGHSELTNGASPGGRARSVGSRAFFLANPPLSRPTPLLAQTCADQGLGGRGSRGRRQGKSLIRPSPAAGLLQRRVAYTKTAAEAPGFRPGRSRGTRSSPTAPHVAAGSPAPPVAPPQPPRQARPPPPARGPLVNPCPPARPLIGGGGAPGQRGPPPTPFSSPPPPPPQSALPHPPRTPPFASQPCKSREETRGFTSVFTPITTNPDRTDPD
jgi:hypothetical protein